MRKLCFFLWGLALILLLSLVSADGIPIDPYLYTVPALEEESQIALIEFDGENYTTNLFVALDLTQYEQDQLLWIVPFEEAPADVFLEEKTFEEFKEEFSQFDEEMNKAIALNRKYFQGGYAIELLLVEGFFLPGFIWPAVFLFLPMGLMGAAPAGDVMAPSAYGAGMEIVGFKDFGELGTAITYNIKDTTTLENFFRLNNVTMPKNLGEFQGKTIVVFRLNKIKPELNVLARFDFHNKQKIFYPSSTTKLWQGKPENYNIRIKAPKDFKLTANINPNMAVSDTAHQYLVFSSECDPNARYQETGTFKNNCLRDWYGLGYYEEETLPVNERLINEDLEISVQSEHKALPLGLFVASALEGYWLGLILILVCWLVAFFYRCRKKQWKMALPKKIGFSFFLLLAWTVFNVILGFVTLLVLGAFLTLLSLISMLFYALSIPTYEFGLILLVVFMLIIPYGLIAAGLYFGYKKYKASKKLWLLKGKVDLLELVKIYALALGINILLLLVLGGAFLIEI